jgi:acetyl-CoA carboxylase biotin carboxyl carrier protein
VGYELRDVRRVLEAFEQSSWDEIHLKADHFELHVTASGSAPAAPPQLSDDSSTEAPADVVVAEVVETPASAVADGVTATIVSPSLGIFWRAPRPGAPPFADVGDEILPDTTVCIVEVMKLMNQVKAGVAGRVIEILASNGVMVEQDQALFTVLER